MPEPRYAPDRTGLLIVDPYNDFLSEGGKLYPYCAETIAALGTVANMERVVRACRAAGIRIFIVPHHRWCTGDFTRWKHQPPAQFGASRTRSFEKDTWGGTFHCAFVPEPGDTIAQEHWLSSGFANTDLDLLLRQGGIEKVILIGLRANTCVDSTMRYAAELGYHVTLVTDAIAAFSMAEVTATVELNAPAYASAVLSTDRLVDALDPATAAAP